MIRFIAQILEKSGLPGIWIQLISLVLSLILLGLISWLIFLIGKRILGVVFVRMARRTKSHLDDILILNKIPQKLAWIVPYFFLSWAFPELLEFFGDYASDAEHGFAAVGVILILSIIRSILHSLRDYLKGLDNFKNKPIDSYIQVFLIFLWFIGILLILSVLTGIDVSKFLTGLGALSAVILLVFKDSLLGFVASIQIAVNDTIRIGDWITLKSQGADGDVIEINLSNVKIRNFDNTISVLPTYKLLTESYVNWRGMAESDGRRIKRALHLRIESVRFLNPEELDHFRKIERLSTYIEEHLSHIEGHNSQAQTNKELLLNGRNFTNLGLFRIYVENYLKEHPEINTQLTLLCRQLAPGPQGIPLEIYAFSKDKNWGNYERIASDIFDHLLAALPTFGLECFEFTYSPKK